MQTCDSIGRIQLKRAISNKPAVISKYVHVDILIVTEFFASQIILSHHIYRWKLSWINSLNLNIGFEITTHEHNECTTDPSLKIKYNYPAVPGKYHLKIDCVIDKADVIVLPLYTETIDVKDLNASESDSNRVFSCLRVINFSIEAEKDELIIIRENYAATLGSHLWDSSIILSRYFALNRANYLNGDTVIELGAGLGLCGLWFAKFTNFKRVLITDKLEQLNYIQSNIDLNSLNEKAEVAVLDLSQVSENESFNFVNLIIAADVLYDEGLASCLFATVRKIFEMSIHQNLQLILAQKIRGSEDSKSLTLKNIYDKFLINGFKYCILHEDAGVYVWKLNITTI